MLNKIQKNIHKRKSKVSISSDRLERQRYIFQQMKELSEKGIKFSSSKSLFIVDEDEGVE